MNFEFKGEDTMIKTIKLKNCATYSRDGVSIENCQKINFFYGPNGSGKSTVGKFMQNLSDPQYRDCEIEWENDSDIDILVFNRDFRERNFKENISGVFTLGEASIADKQNIENLKKQRDDKKGDLAKRRSALDAKKKEENQKNDELTDFLWENIYKKNAADFQEAFRGFRNNRNNFKERALAYFQNSHPTEESRVSLLSRAQTILSKKPETYLSIDLKGDQFKFRITQIENLPIWKTVIVGNSDLPIGRLIETLKNADWVNQGRNYLRDDEICPFCQHKTISAELRKQLDDFFSGEFEQNVNLIKKTAHEYRENTESYLHYIKQISDNPIISSIAQIDETFFKSKIVLLESHFAHNKNEMEIKEKEPGRIISLTRTDEIISELQQLLIEGNNKILKHNQLVSNYVEEKNKLTSDIWNFLIKENEQMIRKYWTEISDIKKAKAGMEEGIQIGNNDLAKIESNLMESEKKFTSVQPAINEINRLLKSYDFTNFKLVQSQTDANAYQIQRLNGSLVCNTLSEGEETFILFLYFLQLAKGAADASKISSHKILVIDDPVCSLDSTVLYIVSSLIRQLISDVRHDCSDVKQIFIFTHNVFFHKETAFIDNRAKDCNDINYWMISKNNNVSSIISHGKNNPIKTSYELLWYELKKDTEVSLITTQNIMRRILENYFRIVGKKYDDAIVDSFSNIEEKMICRSLLSWINDGSHSIPDDLYVNSYTDSIGRYKQIFKEIFNKMGHIAHYEMMMK